MKDWGLQIVDDLISSPVRQFPNPHESHPEDTTEGYEQSSILGGYEQSSILGGYEQSSILGGYK